MFSFDEISLEYLTLRRLVLGCLSLRRILLNRILFDKNRIEMFSLRRLVLSCLALRRLVLMFNFEKISIGLFSLR